MTRSADQNILQMCNHIFEMVISIYATFASAVSFLCPQINSVNGGMPVYCRALDLDSSFTIVFFWLFIFALKMPNFRKVHVLKATQL